MHVNLTLSLPAHERLLRATRQAVAGYLRACDVGDEVVEDVVLAVDEACSNVLRHAFPGSAALGTYELRADLRPGEIAIEVIDRGVGFDPMAKGSGGLLQLSGRGMEIMRRLMTSVEVESISPGGGTRLLMRRHLPGADGDARIRRA